jgi:beta-galactosidase
MSSFERARLSLNKGWRYFGGDVNGAEAVEFDDSGWTRINLPHTWNAEDTQDDEPGYRRGVGWYRRVLKVSRTLKGKRLILYFEGANQVADVFVNGRLAGQHKGGYTAFAFDVTDLARFDSRKNENTLAVKVDNDPDKNIPPLSADFDFYGGIYRNVWLIATQPVHFNLLDHASPGIYADTPTISDKAAVVRIRAQVTNSDVQSRNVKIVSTVIDQQGRVVATADSSQQVQAGGEVEFKLLTKPISHPHLWSPEDPYLYTLKSRLYQNGRLVDSVETALGFRWFRVDPDKGFFLNDKALKLRGVNKHQDYAGMGNAVPNALAIRDMQIIKEMGANFVRLAHYPQSAAVLDAADRLGLIIWEEIPIVNEITTSEEFAQSCENMLREMIRQHYNHPAVLMWGYMNEVFLRPHSESRYREKVVELARRLDNIAHNEDPMRLSVMAMHHSEIYNQTGLADVPQAVGWNLYFGWYEGKFDDLGQFLDDQHKRCPHRLVFISEYGADADRRLHSMNPERYDYTIEWQRLLHETYLDQIDQRPFLAGTALWLAFDFGSESRGESKPHMNQKGLLTFDRQPKDLYYFYQASLSRKPVLHIAVRDWPKRADVGADNSQSAVGAQEVVQRIEVYTNLPLVELEVNRHALGVKSVDKSNHVSWQVPFRNGVNFIEARGSGNNSRSRDPVEIRIFCYLPNLQNSSIGFREIAIDAGSSAQYVDADGTIWMADQPYSAGEWGYVGGTVKRTSRNILGTLDDHLYQFNRQGMKSYRFDVPNGSYKVELLLAEPEFTEVGKRTFNVGINGKTVIENLDLVREGAVLRPFKRNFQVEASGGRGFVISFSGGNGIVSGIRIKRDQGNVSGRCCSKRCAGYIEDPRSIDLHWLRCSVR